MTTLLRKISVQRKILIPIIIVIIGVFSFNFSKENPILSEERLEENVNLSENVSIDPIPCSFSWKSASINNGTGKNYVTSIDPQPYQGPCYSFAVAEAIEDMYNIENNITDTFS